MRPSGASLAVLRMRAALLASLRAFFAAREVLEVDTPALYPGAPAQSTLQTFAFDGPDGRAWHLQTSPEFALKRLLASHPVAMYQLGHVFRRGESGRLHNPEFTMLEWYRPGFTLAELEVECLELLIGVLGEKRILRVNYADALRQHADIDPDTCTDQQLANLAAGLLPGAASLGRDACLDLVFEERVRPTLPPDAFTVLYDFPASQAELAEVYASPGQAARACRFEIFHLGMELLNAASELRDAAEYRRRQADWNARRIAEGLAAMPEDSGFAAALDQLPACSGAALGVDRLLLCLSRCASVDEVMPFSSGRL